MTTLVNCAEAYPLSVASRRHAPSSFLKADRSGYEARKRTPGYGSLVKSLPGLLSLFLVPHSIRFGRGGQRSNAPEPPRPAVCSSCDAQLVYIPGDYACATNHDDVGAEDSRFDGCCDNAGRGALGRCVQPDDGMLPPWLFTRRRCSGHEGGELLHGQAFRAGLYHEDWSEDSHGAPAG